MYSEKPRSPRRRRGTRGVSLVEALAAIGLVSVGLLGFASRSVSVTRGAKMADSVSSATGLALQKMEQLRSMPLGAAQLASGQYSDDGTLKADGTAGGLYTRSWVVSAINQPTWGLKTVTVTVAWTDSSAHTAKLSAYVRCSTIPCA
jgi:Tfp pilus assembly protein PilV